MVKSLFNPFQFLQVLFRKRINQVLTHHLTTVARNAIDQEAKDVGAQIQQRERRNGNAIRP